MIAVSIVSHGHGAMVRRLVAQLSACPEVSRIIVTRNLPEPDLVSAGGIVEVIDNGTCPRGFAENHNAAFLLCREAYFCPLNPDIELDGNPFPALLAALDDCCADIVAPLVRSPGGVVEDYARRFPTPGQLLVKAFGGDGGRYRVQAADPAFFPEWVAGMFMLFRSASFAALRGFDEGFFLYYEDVDICVRAWQNGMRVLSCPRVEVVHDARRDSRRKLAHLRWHLASMCRYFRKHLGHLPVLPAAD